MEVSRFEHFLHLDFSYLDVLHLYISPNIEISYDNNDDNDDDNNNNDDDDDDNFISSNI